jgi:hypothetical protein
MGPRRAGMRIACCIDSLLGLVSGWNDKITGDKCQYPQVQLCTTLQSRYSSPSLVQDYV